MAHPPRSTGSGTDMHAVSDGDMTAIDATAVSARITLYRKYAMLCTRCSTTS